MPPASASSSGLASGECPVPDNRIPFLFWTDAPDKPTGLARICRDLCFQMLGDEAVSQKYRIGTLGFYGKGSARLPWQQYTAKSVEEGTESLPVIWPDFCYDSEQQGILFTITPPTWIFSITCPEFAIKERPAKEKEMWEWYIKRPYKHWAYLAVESCSSNLSGLTYSRPIIYMMQKLDRTLFYSHWGAQIAAQCMNHQPNFQYLSHGIYTQYFKPSDEFTRTKERQELGLEKNDVMLGCVATNTQRKNLGLLIESYAVVKSKVKDSAVRLWLHTDVAVREWDINGLIGDFNLRTPEDVLVTSTLAMRSDDWMARMYSNCDVFVMPTEGEGFGYPIVEAMACGTPVVTGSFGAQVQFFHGFHPEWLCNPVNLSLHGTNNLLRPSYNVGDFADKIIEVLLAHRQDPAMSSDCRQWSLQWDWNQVWPSWHDWFLNTHPQPVAAPPENTT